MPAKRLGARSINKDRLAELRDSGVTSEVLLARLDFIAYESMRKDLVKLAKELSAGKDAILDRDWDALKKLEQDLTKIRQEVSSLAGSGYNLHSMPRKWAGVIGGILEDIKELKEK